MKVYVVMEGHPNEGMYLCSVWSNREMAEKERLRLDQNKVSTEMIHGEPFEFGHDYYYEIEECELDQPYKEEVLEFKNK